MKVQWLYDWIDGFAPFETAEGYDNTGVLTGCFDREVTGVLISLDCTPQTVKEAQELGANVILTHHPLMFAPRQQLREEDYEGKLLCALIRANITLISAHTNLDKAPGGINDALIQKLGVLNYQADGYLRWGQLSQPMAAGQLKDDCVKALGAPVRLYGPEDKLIETLCVGSGADSEDWALAKAKGAQAYLTGEVRHHYGIEAVQEGMILLEAGHYGTENPGMDALQVALQTALDAIQCRLAVYRSHHVPYQGALDRA